MKQFYKEYLSHIKLFSSNAKLFLIGGFFNGIGMAVFSLLFNLYLKEHGYQETQIGQILSWGSLGSVVIAIPAAIILEKVSFKYVLILSTILAGFGYAFSVFFKNLSLIFFFMFFANMFISVYRVSIAPFFMQNSTKKERLYLFSIHSAMMMISQLLGFLIGGYCPDLLLSFNICLTLPKAYEISLYLSVLGTLVSLIPFAKLKASQQFIRSYKSKFRLKDYNWPILFRLMLPKLLIGFGAGMVIPFMNLYFKNEFNLSSGKIGTIFSLMQVVMFIGMILAPLISKKLGMINMIVLTEMISIPFMFILALTRLLPLAIIAFILRGTLMNMNLPVSANFEMELVKPNEQAFTNALSSLAWQGSWTISTYAGGFIIEKYSFAFSFYITIFTYLISASLYYFFFSHLNTKQETA